MKIIARRLQKILQNKPLLVIGIPFLIYSLHALYFGNWIIDDAGISYVYARNLAAGYGLVSQPGVNPVEGYSNFTWIMVLAPFFFLKIFNPYITVKILGTLFVLGSFIVLYKVIRSAAKRWFLGTIFVLFLLAVNTSFTVWSISGLENSLYAFLVFTLTYQLVIVYERSQWTKQKGLILGSLSVIIAMTRPDGIIYVFALPLIVAIEFMFNQKSRKMLISHIAVYISIVIILLGIFLLFRFYYFNDIFPNTYYTKYRDTFPLFSPVYITQIVTLFNSVVWFLGLLLLFSIVPGTVYLIKNHNFSKTMQIVLIMLTISIVTYVLLPKDWMGEYRFATPFYGLLYTYLYLSFDKFITGKKKNLYFKAGAIFFVIVSTVMFIYRSYFFKKNSIVTFALVAQLYGSKFDQLAYSYRIENPSLLLPDVGGTLYYSKIRIYDLAGLTDRVIAKSIYKNKLAFYNYIFDDIKPTFIHIHDKWTYIARLDKDKRFRRDYISLQEEIDPYIKEWYGQELYSGDYMRKDAIKKVSQELLGAMIDRD